MACMSRAIAACLLQQPMLPCCAATAERGRYIVCSSRHAPAAALEAAAGRCPPPALQHKQVLNAVLQHERQSERTLMGATQILYPICCRERQNSAIYKANPESPADLQKSSLHRAKQTVPAAAYRVAEANQRMQQLTAPTGGAR
jgi:hypothetical protein